MKKSDRVFGIDLGTTYSCISYVDDYGKVQVIPNERNQRTTPSVVWFKEDNRVVVGEEAKEATPICPNDVCQFVKRSMGDSSFYAVYSGEARTPEEISSFILKKLAKDASEALGEEVKDVVITCPAYFFIKERNATKRAGELAGLNVLHILNEPTAAAISYGLSAGGEDKTILVFDLGGGTFDVTSIHFGANEDRVLFTDGDHRLGGKDWDDRLVRLIAERYQEETGSGEDLLQSQEALAELFLIAERAKKQLSEREKTSVRFTYGEESVRFDVTREEFENITSDLLTRTIEFTRNIFEKTRETGELIREILLVGGSSKMPAVAERIEREFGMKPKLYDPDEAVARGAGIFGNNLRLRKIAEEKTGKKTTELTLEDCEDVAADCGYTLETVQKAMRTFSNVTSKTFGQSLVSAKTGKDAVYNYIYRYTPLPAEETQINGTLVDNQENVLVEIYSNTSSRPTNPENEDLRWISYDECELIWKGVLDLPNKTMPAGSPIKSTFEISDEGLLTVTVTELKTGANLVAHIDTTDPDASLEKFAQEKREQEKRCSELILE
ncbi:MAG: Hsp70 family protein [Thermoguttaceae bacterium]|nr:Hsp70 family protein [Thermoguttaceae bacterium]